MSEIRRTGSPDQVFGPDLDEELECPVCEQPMRASEAIQISGVWQHARCARDLDRARAVMDIAHALGTLAFSQWFSLTPAQRADLVEAADDLIDHYLATKEQP